MEDKAWMACGKVLLENGRRVAALVHDGRGNDREADAIVVVGDGPVMDAAMPLAAVVAQFALAAKEAGAGGAVLQLDPSDSGIEGAAEFATGDGFVLHVEAAGSVLRSYEPGSSLGRLYAAACRAARDAAWN